MDKIRNRFKSKKFVLAAVVIVLIICGFMFLRQRNGNTNYDEVAVSNIIVKKTVVASGSVTAEKEVNLSFQNSGRIVSSKVDKGVNVTSGSVLAQIDAYSASKSVQSSKDARDVAVKDLEIYIKNYSNKPDVVGGKDEYALNVARLQELLNSAEASYQAQLGTLGYNTIRAPFDGTIIDVFYKEGETVGMGSPVMRIADLQNLIFNISLDQEDFGLVKVGMSVEVTLDAYANDVFFGVVSEIPYYADPNTEEFEIKVRFENLDQNEATPLMGMKGDAEISVEQTDSEVQALVFDSINEDEDGAFVWVLNQTETVKEGEFFAKKYIEVGLEGDLYTEVKTDLTDFVVVTPEETPEQYAILDL